MSERKKSIQKYRSNIGITIPAVGIKAGSIRCKSANFFL
ncbi:hypothetical protein LEP1GSC193_4368 [Leptospira alstonii serovar Pingchang str. 80-412]|uniref:Uncharacterized protein n=2 Tax=Leptospira alstonii TaxID=28452 RepID=M6CTD1_9LEPT|nr:hypothetical protein LEP1GSC194_1944 [Leptospira alstonii serovar Sichuan str. 79601]EQA80349.1 hypothetical protein LEP1GSC193_4368 [Leptospira alstonii serovar Pingchang str. 80-412]